MSILGCQYVWLIGIYCHYLKGILCCMQLQVVSFLYIQQSSCERKEEIIEQMNLAHKLSIDQFQVSPYWLPCPWHCERNFNLCFRLNPFIRWMQVLLSNINKGEWCSIHTSLTFFFLLQYLYINKVYQGYIIQWGGFIYFHYAGIIFTSIWIKFSEELFD